MEHRGPEGRGPEGRGPEGRGPEGRGPERPSGSAADEALRRLENRLSRASEAAERLIAQAADSAVAAASGARERAEAARAGGWAGSGGDERAEAAGSGSGTESRPSQPPPSGWQLPGGEEEHAGDLELLMQVVRSLRDLIPPDLQRRLAEALRELLLALRALIDWYLERSEQRRSTRAEMEDIPIL